MTRAMPYLAAWWCLFGFPSAIVALSVSRRFRARALEAHGVSFTDDDGRIWRTEAFAAAERAVCWEFAAWCLFATSCLAFLILAVTA